MKEKPKRVKRVKNTNEEIQEPVRLETVITKEDWCIFIKNNKTDEIYLLACHYKQVIKNVKDTKNKEIDFLAKGPYLYIRNETTIPSLEEFNKLK